MLNRPDVIEGVHESMVEAGAEVVETDTFQGSRLKLDEWGLGEHTLEINRKAAEIARKAVGDARFVAGSIGPTGFLPASDDPTLGAITFRRPGRGLRRAGARPGRGRRRPDHHRDGAGHPRGQGGGVRRSRGVRSGRPRRCRSRPRSRCCRRAARCCSAPTSPAVLTTLAALEVDVIGLNCSTGPEDMRDAIRFLGEHSPLPVHCIPNAGPAAPGAGRRDDLPRDPGADLDGARRVRRAPWRRIVGGCCGTTPEHIAAIAERVDGRVPGERPASRRAAGQLDDDRDRPGPGAAPDPGRRAGQLPGLAQGEGAAARRRLRRPRPGRRGPGRRRRPRARRLRGADRAPGRGRPDERGRPAGLADPAGADPDRLDRARGDRGGARAHPGPGDRQLDQPRGRPRQGRPRHPAGEGSTAPR